MSEKDPKVGLIQIYTGDGKGKTTAALGLALRACGHEMKVYMIQFMKGDINYGEIIAQKWIPHLTIVQFGRTSFVDKKNPAPEDIELAKEALEHANEIILRAEHDIVILDELNVAIDFRLVDVDEVIELLKSKPRGMEIIITGRNAHEKILNFADLVTQMENVKHPYDKGVSTRCGIEH